MEHVNVRGLLPFYQFLLFAWEKAENKARMPYLCWKWVFINENLESISPKFDYFMNSIP